MSEPITRSEMYLAALGGEAVTPPEPITRMDMYMAYLNGMTDTYPEPITRTEQYLYKLCQNGMGGGGGVTIRNQNKTITENGSYRADSGYTGLGTVTVNVPQEEPVLQDKTVTENGTVTADPGYDGLGVVTVNVEADGGGDDIARAIVERTITQYSDSEQTVIGEYSFYNCQSLETVNTPNVVKILDCAFNKCTALKNVTCDKVTQVNGRGFAGCTALETISLPLLGGVTLSYGFDGCTSLKNVHIPKVERLSIYAFRGCSSLEKLDFPSLGKLDGGVFDNCVNLKTVIFRKNEVIALSNVSILNNTPFASGGTGGTVYCPATLITQYQQATNWATLYAAGTCNFVAIEGSEYE